MSHRDEPFAASATLPSPAPRPPVQTASSSEGSFRTKLAAILFAMSIVALVMALYRQSTPPDPAIAVKQFLHAIARGDKRAAAPYLAGLERGELGKVSSLQWELQMDSTNAASMKVKTTVGKITTSRAFVEATISRDGDAFTLQFILEPDRSTGWKIRDIQQAPPSGSRKGDLSETPEERELRERLIHDLGRDGQTPVETDDR